MLRLDAPAPVVVKNFNFHLGSGWLNFFSTTQRGMKTDGVSKWQGFLFLKTRHFGTRLFWHPFWVSLLQRPNGYQNGWGITMASFWVSKTWCFGYPFVFDPFGCLHIFAVSTNPWISRPTFYPPPTPGRGVGGGVYNIWPSNFSKSGVQHLYPVQPLSGFEKGRTHFPLVQAINSLLQSPKLERRKSEGSKGGGKLRWGENIP